MVYNLQLTDEELAKAKLCHGNFINNGDGFEESLLWLSDYLASHKGESSVIYDLEEKSGVELSNQFEPCRIAGADILIFSGRIL